jgi:hypothetical protein
MKQYKYFLFSHYEYKNCITETGKINYIIVRSELDYLTTLVALNSLFAGHFFHIRSANYTDFIRHNLSIIDTPEEQILQYPITIYKNFLKMNFKENLIMAISHDIKILLSKLDEFKTTNYIKKEYLEIENRIHKLRELINQIQNDV